MIRSALVALAALWSAGGAVAAPQDSTPAMALWRLDCGQFDIDKLEERGRVVMPVSCYLVRHGDDYVMFDAGLTDQLVGRQYRDEKGKQTITVATSLAAQLERIGVDPAKIGTLVISHYHGDHHGQAGLFPNARLVMGEGDVAALREEKDREALEPWFSGARAIDPVTGDRDLFGDGRVRLLFTPGHTPGHTALFVRLGSGDAFILSGDYVHFRDQLVSLAPPGNHVDKVRGKAEIERINALAASEKATIVVGHDSRDIALLPAFPAARE